MREKRGVRSRSCNCWKGGKKGRGRGVVFRWTASLISHVAEPSASSSRKTPPMCQLIPSSPGIGAERGRLDYHYPPPVYLLCGMGDVVGLETRYLVLLGCGRDDGRGEGGVRVLSHTYVPFAN